MAESAQYTAVCRLPWVRFQAVDGERRERRPPWRIRVGWREARRVLCALSVAGPGIGVCAGVDPLSGDTWIAPRPGACGPGSAGYLPTATYGKKVCGGRVYRSGHGRRLFPNVLEDAADHLLKWSRGVDFKGGRFSQQRLHRLQIKQRFGEFFGAFAVGIVRAASEAFHEYRGWRAEQHDVIELRVEPHLVAARAAYEEQLGVGCREGCLDPILAPESLHSSA